MGDGGLGDGPAQGLAVALGPLVEPVLGGLDVVVERDGERADVLFEPYEQLVGGGL
ncbi:hypothetical protein BH24ACT6_BH24ACT6_15180 [soil metagenome]